MSIFGPTLMPWPDKVERAFPIVIGATCVVLAAVPVMTAVVTTNVVRGNGPRLRSIAIGVAAVGSAAAVGRSARRRFVRKLRDGARELDPGFQRSPESPLVSTGPGSLLDAGDVGREGARYVGTATTTDDVTFVTGEPPSTAPIRVFVGLDAAESIEQRVALAIAELKRTGAFQRSCLLIQAPAGTGFANSTPVDVMELLTRGDCASVAVGYGLLPSFLSLDRVEIARRTQSALFEAIADECAALDDAPRLLLYGESLGAKVQQAALQAGVEDLDRLGIDAAVWVGTPGGRDYDRAHRAFEAVAVTVDRPEQIPAATVDQPEPRVWFLEHDGDPVVRFRSDLVHARPAWLTGPRGRGVPEDMVWRPGVTWAQVLVDTVYATDVTPGDFRSSGHDYRADLGAVVTRAFGLALAEGNPTHGWRERLEQRLRDLEVRRARLVGGTG
ncbi:MAG: alpha/beta-hydrolase family protein [Candidatus Nanopelagicales bacterium]